MCDGKGVRSLIDWIIKVEKVAKHTQCPEIQLACGRAEGLVYELIEAQDTAVPKLNKKANLTCYKGEEKGHLAPDCPHTSNTAVTQSQ